MTTYRELIYMCLDEVKAISDDNTFTEDHVTFLLSKYRTALLKQAYLNGMTTVPDSNYQTLCLNVEKYNTTDANVCGKGTYLRSTEKIPFTLPIGNVLIYTDDFFGKRIYYVSRERMRYTGSNKWTKNVIYATIGPDNYLYLKSQNNSYLYLKKVTLTGVFEDANKASELECDQSDIPCDLYDKSFPLEEGLINTLIQQVVKELLAAEYRPKDNLNNANDDISTLAEFVRRNVKKSLKDTIDDATGTE